MVSTVCSGEMQATAPTRRMSANSARSKRVPRMFSDMRARPEARVHHNQAAPAP